MTGEKGACIEREIAALDALDRSALLQRWRSAFGRQAPPRLSRSLLVKAVAHEMQVRAFGGLSPRTIRALKAAAKPKATSITDETGDRLTPSHAIRRGKRHRYYVSRRLIAHSGERNTGGCRLPAVALETAVARLITDALTTQQSAWCLVRDVPAEQLQKLPSKVQSLVAELTGHDRAAALGATIKVGRIEPGRLSLTLDPAALVERLGVLPTHINHRALTLIGEFTLRRRGVEARLILGDTSSGVDGTLIKNVAQGWRWFEEIKAGMTMQAIADREGVTQRRVAHLVDLAFLPPDIVQAIVDGRQPATLTADSLIKSRHRLIWADQKAWLATL